MLFMASNTLVN